MIDVDNSTALLIIVSDFRNSAYASTEGMFADAWISSEAHKLKMPVAVAELQNFSVARECTTRSLRVGPLPSSFFRYTESLPITIDTVF
ncbi:MAG: hypothetical protein ACKPKO_35285, partial [Candidatus Fonsibacter sp.]